MSCWRYTSVPMPHLLYINTLARHILHTLLYVSLLLLLGYFYRRKLPLVWTKFGYRHKFTFTVRRWFCKSTECRFSEARQPGRVDQCQAF